MALWVGDQSREQTQRLPSNRRCSVPAPRPVDSPRSAYTRRARLRSSPVIRVVQPAPEVTYHPIGQFIVRSFFLLLACSLAFAGYWLVTNPSLGVTSIEVRGAYYLKPAEVTRAANVIGTSPFFVSSGPVRERILALGVPRDVSVRFRPPNVVVIAIKERTAAYNWKVDGTTFAVSDDGVILGQTLDPAQQVVTAAGGSSIKPGDRVDSALLREAAYLSLAVPKVAGFAPGSIAYSKERGLSFQATRGVQIVVGDDQLLEKKVAAVAPALNAALAQAVVPKVIDLRVPSHPIMR